MSRLGRYYELYRNGRYEDCHDPSHNRGARAAKQPINPVGKLSTTHVRNITMSIEGMATCRP